jgi:hypothetical protein
MIRRWSPPHVAPPVGRYSHLAAVPTGHEPVVAALARPDLTVEVEAVVAVPPR